MFCPNCGQKVADGCKHCPNCGAELSVAEPAAFEERKAPVLNEENVTPEPGCFEQAPKAPFEEKPEVKFEEKPYYQSAPAYEPEAVAPENNKKKVFAIIGFVASLLAILGCCVPYLGIVSSLVGFVFSIIGLKATKCRGLAVAGLIISIVDLLFWIVICVLAAAMGGLISGGIFDKFGDLGSLFENGEFNQQEFEEYFNSLKQVTHLL